MVLWLPMFFGEELGWQGYLLPRLAALGTLHVGLNGWPGWVVMGVFVAVLAGTRQFRWRHPQ